MEGNGDGTAGDNATDDFFRLYGDANGSGNVDVFDLLQFRIAYNTMTGDADYNANLDFGNDGRINVFDLLEFRKRFGTSIL